MTKKLKLCTPVGAAGQAVQGTAQPLAGKSKKTRFLGESIFRPPEGAIEDAAPNANPQRMVMPAAAVARQWGISTRRVRQMLEQGRLEGRQQANGYWEVLYPYRYQLGTRGPQLKRQREPIPKPSYRPNPLGSMPLEQRLIAEAKLEQLRKSL